MRAEIKPAATFSFVWDGALLDPGGLVVVKGAPHKEAAFKYIEYYQNPGLDGSAVSNF